MPFIVVFFGAGVGGMLRHAVNLVAAHFVGTSFPFGTMFINIVGSLAMAILSEIFALRLSLPQDVRLFLTTGVLGGFTTFSAFSLETIGLWERGQGWLAATYSVGSVAVALFAFLAGLWLTRLILGPAM